MTKTMSIQVTERQQVSKAIMAAFIEEFQSMAYGEIRGWKDSDDNDIEPAPITFLKAAACWGKSNSKYDTIGFTIGRNQPVKIHFNVGCYYRKASVEAISVTSEGAILSATFTMNEWSMFMDKVVSKIKEDDKYYSQLLKEQEKGTAPSYGQHVIPEYAGYGVNKAIAACF